MEKVVNVKVKYIRPQYKNLREWIEDPNNVYIGRKGIVFVETDQGKERFPKQDSIWANPFKLKKGATKKDRLLSIKAYKKYIVEKLEKGEITYAQLKKLKGKNLGCWCKGDYNECHGDVLVELLECVKD